MLATAFLSARSRSTSCHLLQCEVLIVELQDEVQIGGRVPAPDVVGDGIPVVPDPFEINSRLPLRPHRTGTTSRATAAFGVGFDGGGGGGGGRGEEAGSGAAKEGAGESPKRGEGCGAGSSGGGDKAAAGQHLAGEVEVVAGGRPLRRIRKG